MSWNFKQVNAGGLPNGPPTVSNPFASVFKQEWHVTYQDEAGTIWIIALPPL